jgi:hypothetical protein
MPGAGESRQVAADREGGALLGTFDRLGALDPWAKIALERLRADPGDPRAAGELLHSLEHTARLHPAFAHELECVVGDQTATATALPPTVAMDVSAIVGTQRKPTAQPAS